MRPRVDPGLILRLQKYRKLEAVPALVRQAARAMAEVAETLVEAEARLWRGSVSRVEPAGRVLLGNGIAFHSRALARLLRDAARVNIVLLTIGPRLEMRAREMMAEERFLEALLLDTAGWVAIDGLAKALRRDLAAEATAQGFRLTHRMAPGYADWGLEQQQVLFSAFGKDSLPVHLTESCVMLPQKSISGIYGLIPATHTT